MYGLVLGTWLLIELRPTRDGLIVNEEIHSFDFMIVKMRSSISICYECVGIDLEE